MKYDYVLIDIQMLLMYNTSESAWELHDILKRAYQILYLSNHAAHHSEDSMALSHTSMKHKSSYKITQAFS